MVDYMEDGYNETLEKYLKEFCKRERERRNELDKEFGNIIRYNMHGVKGLLHYISLLETGKIDNLDLDIAKKEAQELRNKLYEINRKYCKPIREVA